MNTQNNLFSEFDKVLKIYNLENYSKLKPPLPSEDIQNFLSKLLIENPFFKSFYQWKNGVASASGATMKDQIFQFGAPVSLEYVLERFLDVNVEVYWEKKFHPIVTDGDGAFLLFNNESGKDYGKLHLYSPPLLYIDEPISYYDSIQSMIETTIKAYQEKAIIFNSQDGWLYFDSEKLNVISAYLNPLSEFWKL